MQDQRRPMNSESARSEIDHLALTAVAQVLVSAIGLERRILRVAARLSMLPSQHASVLSVGRSTDSQESDRGLLVPDGRGD
jgi:hypothetical protein